MDFSITLGSIPIIGVGGISNGQEAYDKIRSGASLVQLYTAFVYQGPPVVYSVATQLAELLRYYLYYKYIE
jgi:dihydroorotate dehydrogenase